MKKLLILLIFFISCEKDIIGDISNRYLELSSELSYDGEIYTFNYPLNATSSYFKVDFTSLPQERIYWDSPDMFYVILDIYNDTIWDACVNYSTYANDEGAGHQMVCVHPTLIGDTLNLIGVINDLYGNEVMRKEILVKIQ